MRWTAEQLRCTEKFLPPLVNYKENLDDGSALDFVNAYLKSRYDQLHP